MEYDDILKELESFGRFGIKPGLERIRYLMDNLGNPQEKLKIVHVAGTNGKGSTCTMISSILSSSGYKVGLYTSPSLIDFRERIKISNKEISQDEIKSIFPDILNIANMMKKAGEAPTEFEIVTAMAFEYFHRMKCDIVVLETGLGGKFDATNIITSPMVSVITSISLDHTDILGKTIQEIALQKCGIIKKSSPIVLYPEQHGTVKDIVKKYAQGLNCQLTISNQNSLKILSSKIENGTNFIFNTTEFHIPLLGEHQVLNAITAIETVNILKNEFSVKDSDIYNGLTNSYIPARMQLLSLDPLIILDGAHNPSGALSLSNALKRYIPNKKIIAITGMLSDKDFKTSISYILPLCHKVLTVPINNERFLSLKNITAEVKKYCLNTEKCESIAQAIKTAISYSSIDTSIIIFGSLYLAGEVLNIFNDPHNLNI